MARQNRSYFFGPTGTTYTKFSTDNKPTQERFMELFMSVPFFAELESMAQNRVPGLIALPSKSDLMTLMGKYNNIPLVVTPQMLPFIGPDWVDMPIAPAIYDSEERYTTDPSFDPILNTAKGITVKQAYLGDLGNSIFAIMMAINSDQFEFDETGQLCLNTSDGPIIVDGMLSEISHLKLMNMPTGGFAIGDSEGEAMEVTFEENSILYRGIDAEGEPVFGTIGFDGDIIRSGSSLAIGANKVTVNKMARRDKGSVLVGAGAGSDLTEVVLNAQGKFLMGLSTGNAGVVTLGGVMSVDDSGNLNYKINTIYGKHLHSSFIHNGIELIDLGAGEKAIATKVQKSIEKNSSGVQLKNDEESPGNYKYYGTDGSGNKGYNTLPSGVFTEGTGVDSVKQNSAEGATKKHAIATGNALSKWRGSIVRSIDDDKEANQVELIYKGSTSDATQTEITLAGEASEFFDNIPDNCVMNCVLKTTAVDDSGNTHTQIIHSAYKNVATVMSSVGALASISEEEDGAMTGVISKTEADDANNRIKILVQGLAATNIKWMVTLKVDLLKF